jgi:3-hydroxybutyryl-CoA dehydrogenase
MIRKINKFLFSSNIKSIGIIGSGQMGTGIAYVFNRQAGKNVIIYDSNKAQLQKSESFISKLIEKEIQKKSVTEEEKERILKRFTYSDNIQSLVESNFIIEAATENFEVKSKIFKQLDEISSKETILASNTSSISITKLASTVNRPDKIIGMHFMNPVPIMKLVEVIKGLPTSTDTFNTTIDLIKLVNKQSAVSEDVPGFIVNRILMPMINEAVFTLYEGIASKEDIDKAMVLGTNVPMGPLTLADFIGLDTCLYILNVLHTELKDPKFRPCILLTNYVNAGWLGKKTGRGFYDYSQNKK